MNDLGIRVDPINWNGGSNFHVRFFGQKPESSRMGNLHMGMGTQLVRYEHIFISMGNKHIQPIKSWLGHAYGHIPLSIRTYTLHVHI
jgi:hypothetical protein